MTGCQRRGLVVGRGGTLGFAWAVAAPAAVEEQRDWDARTAEVLVGRSAVAEAVSAATETRSGTRVAFGSPDAPVADIGSAIAASWAIPGWFPPVRIDARTYLEGGMVSPTSADLVAPLGLDEAVIVAPMTTSGGAPATGLSRLERVVRRWMTRPLDAEEHLLPAVGTRVVRIEPGAGELAVMGVNFMDVARRPATLDVSLRTAPDRVKRAIDRSTKA